MCENFGAACPFIFLSTALTHLNPNWKKCWRFAPSFLFILTVFRCFPLIFKQLQYFWPVLAPDFWGKNSLKIYWGWGKVRIFWTLFTSASWGKGPHAYLLRNAYLKDTTTSNNINKWSLITIKQFTEIRIIETSSFQHILGLINQETMKFKC